MVTPYNDKEEKSEQVRRMFNHIASGYDRINHLISWGMDRYWRNKAIELLQPYHPERILDIATGTADFAINIATQLPNLKHIDGIDISDEMLRIAAEKIRVEGLEHLIELKKADATELPFEDNEFDAVTIAFGLRNVDRIDVALAEAYRILKPGAPMLILELSEPTNGFLRAGYKFYAHKILPLLGRTLSLDKQAYKYLPESVGAVPQRKDLVSIMEKTGFVETFFRSISPGVVTIYLGMK